MPLHALADLSNATAASQAEMEAGTETALRVMSPLRVSQAIAALGGGGSGVGAEVKPDATWNTLTRGYMLYSGAELNLVMGAGGEFDLVSYTAPTVNLRTHTEALGSERASAADIAFFGQLSVTLAPTVAHTFSTFSEVAIGETVTINCNANVTLDHVPGVLEMSTGVDYVSSGTVALSATRAADGALEVTIP